MPVQQSLGASAAAVSTRHVPWPPRRLDGADRPFSHAIKSRMQFAHRRAGPGTQVDSDGVSFTEYLIESVQRGDMCLGEVPDVYVVPDSRAVSGRIVGARDLKWLASLLRLDELAEGVRRSGDYGPALPSS